jgi:hypothetical protein
VWSKRRRRNKRGHILKPVHVEKEEIKDGEEGDCGDCGESKQLKR